MIRLLILFCSTLLFSKNSICQKSQPDILDFRVACYDKQLFFRNDTDKNKIRFILR